MTERERLIELLCTAPLGSRTFEEQYYKSTISKIADHLLANGVVVPPCKVGDKVYIKNKPLVISFIHIESEIIKYVIQFDCCDCGDCPFYENIEGEYFCITNGYIEFTANDIGKTVFLTKEEAEKALERRNENVTSN